jgi:hypothetical protein
MKRGLRIFDTHTHIGTARHCARSFSAGELLSGMDRYGVDRALAIPFPVVEDYPAANDEVGRAVARWPDRLSGAACLYPYIPERQFRDEVRRCRETYGFRALKYQPQYHGLNPLWPTSDVLFESALENGLTLVVHTGTGIPYSLPSLYMPAARKYPDLRIVLSHCGGGGLLVGEAVVAASFCPNIYLELSSLMPNHIHEVLHNVPSTRLMIGSDLPECLDVEMDKILNLAVPGDDKQNILWNTAAALF